MSAKKRHTPDVFYPIVPDTKWLKRLLPLGVRTVQLRLKNIPLEEVRTEIAIARDLARQYSCQLIVNDYWAEAIELGVPCVHLGQEDLDTADLSEIKRASLSLGISTHDEAELDRALALDPDYIALGPIFETKLKVMRFRPQGIENVRLWKSRIGAIPLVAIGGLTIKRANDVLDAGAQSISVITDFFTHQNPEVRVAQWLDWAHNARQTKGVLSDTC